MLEFLADILPSPGGGLRYGPTLPALTAGGAALVWWVLWLKSLRAAKRRHKAATKLLKLAMSGTKGLRLEHQSGINSDHKTGQVFLWVSPRSLLKPNDVHKHLNTIGENNLPDTESRVDLSIYLTPQEIEVVHGYCKERIKQDNIEEDM